ncbi:GNAT family N-acetyltransferase [Mucilaginibacter sp. UYCu711]|uniref:GNAT family N-acetyltransferase n=1 Tax=Mucilaginibacter sp. UYCu711 TaxID=3156339 RepID=UPI003D24DE20
MDNINITKITPQRLKALHYISYKTFVDAFAHLNNPADLEIFLSDHLTEESLGEEIRNPGSEFYFAEINDQPIAYFKINTGNAQTELRETQGLEIERIYVLQGYQGKKIGELLITEIIKLAKQQNKTYIWLGAWEINLRGISFYQKNGFVIFDKHQFKVGNDIQTDIMMKLKLK